MAYHLEATGVAARGVYVTLAGGYAVDTGGAVDSVTGFETVVGTNNLYPGGYWSDFIFGDNYANTIYAASGNDYMSGGFGSATLYGGTGTDFFVLGGEVQGGVYDLIGDFNADGAPDYLGLAAAYPSLTSFGTSGGYGYAYINFGAGNAYTVLAAGVTGAQLQAQTYFG